MPQAPPRPIPARRRARRYASLVIGAVILATSAAAVVNVRVDPWRVVDSRWADPALDPYRDISSHTRTGKAGLVRHRDDWKVGIFGSSRVLSSLDPRSPAFDDRPAVNLGMPGAFLHENLAMAGYFLDQCQPELLLFGVDPGDLASPLDTRPMGDFAASPLNPHNALDRELRYRVGLSTLEASLETLQHQARGTTAEYDARGLRVRRRAASLGSEAQIAFIRNRFIDDARVARPPERLEPDKLDGLLRLMTRCRRSGVRLVLFLHAQHALLHADPSHPERLPFELDRRTLVDLLARARVEVPDGAPIELWDFHTYHPINTERVRPLEGRPHELVHWRDLEHFTAEVGEAMLARMLGDPAPPDLADYGAPLEPATLEPHLASLRAAYTDYLQSQADGDLAWRAHLIASSRQ